MRVVALVDKIQDLLNYWLVRPDILVDRNAAISINEGYDTDLMNKNFIKWRLRI